MILIVGHNGRNYPIVTCDVCGEAIEHHEEGAVVWAAEGQHRRLTKDSSEIETFDVHHVHKGPCDDALAERLGGFTLWSPIAEHMRLLWHNLKLAAADTRETDAAVQLFESCGL